MSPRIAGIVIDSADLEGAARFWGTLLDLKVTSRADDWLDLERLGPDGPMLSFQQVPERKKGKNRLHFDLNVPDFRGATALARELGGQPAGEIHGAPAQAWQVWRDPEGNEFCLVTEG
jgi:predicted enzyme related to lactoylglutathione lyase